MLVRTTLLPIALLALGLAHPEAGSLGSGGPPSIRPAAAPESRDSDPQETAPQDTAPRDTGPQDTKPRPKSPPLRRRKREGLDSKASTAIKEGLTWLVEHQQEDGSWDCDGFSDRCPKDRCTGHGEAGYDVGVTGLAALALMTFAEPQGTEPVDAALARALDWLPSAQHKTSGLIGAPLGHAFHYDHAVATRALAVAQRRWPELELGDTVQLAVRYIESARNVGAAWRYEMPPNGDNDSSVTAWMCAALIDAERAGSAVDRSAFPEILAWLASVTQADSSRVGYTSPNGESARVPGMNDHYGSGDSETLTAAALATRLRLGEELSPERLLTEELSLVLAASPRIQTRKPALEWGDYYYWYHASESLQLSPSRGKRKHRSWYKALQRSLSKLQEGKGHAAGSWSPTGPWCFAGGRVYSTSLAILALAAPIQE